MFYKSLYTLVLQSPDDAGTHVYYFLVIVADSNNGSGTEKIYLPIPEKYNDTAREIYENAAEDGDALDELLKDFSYWQKIP